MIYDIFLFAVLAIAVLISVTLIASLFVWVPFVPTPPKVVKRMVELAGLKGGETVYDLGCGDGRILVEAKRRCNGISAAGYELPIGIWLLARLRVFFSGKNVDIFLGDFRKADISDADVLFVYLVPEVMEKLRQKFDMELKPGTRVISHGFPFHNKRHVHMERCELPMWHVIRPPKKKGPRIFVYEW